MYTLLICNSCEQKPTVQYPGCSKTVCCTYHLFNEVLYVSRQQRLMIGRQVEGDLAHLLAAHALVGVNQSVLLLFRFEAATVTMTLNIHHIRQWEDRMEQ